MDIVLDASVAVTCALSVGRHGSARLRQRLRESSCTLRTSSTPRWGACFGVGRQPVQSMCDSRRSGSSCARRASSPIATRTGRARLAHGPLRDNVTYYDALYVALAARLGYPLLTADARLARAPGLPCAVELVD